MKKIGFYILVATLVFLSCEKKADNPGPIEYSIAIRNAEGQNVLDPESEAYVELLAIDSLYASGWQIILPDENTAPQYPFLVINITNTKENKYYLRFADGKTDTITIKLTSTEKGRVLDYFFYNKTEYNRQEMLDPGVVR